MSKRKKYPNLRDKVPHPHKHLTVEGVNKSGEAAALPYMKKITIELPYPIVDLLKVIAKQEGETMAGMLRRAIFSSDKIPVKCVDELGPLEVNYLKRDELRALVPPAKRDMVKGARKRTEVGTPTTHRQLIQ
jgi:hypothetical protein